MTGSGNSGQDLKTTKSSTPTALKIRPSSSPSPRKHFSKTGQDFSPSTVSYTPSCVTITASTLPPGRPHDGEELSELDGHDRIERTHSLYEPGVMNQSDV